MNERLRRSRQQEKRAAAVVGGVATPGSGSGWVKKNDARSDRFLVECKRTDNKFRLSLSLFDLDKLETEALLIGKLPVMQAQIHKTNYWVVPDRAWQELLLELELHVQT